jgi:alcohol dehydrogenase class IV
MLVNVGALLERQPDSPSLRRYDEVARILTGDPGAEAADGVQWVRRLCDDLRVPTLAAYGIGPDDFPELVQKAAEASSMKPNPIVLTPAELKEILERAL